jgi:hypothetical protein
VFRSCLFIQNTVQYFPIIGLPVEWFVLLYNHVPNGFLIPTWRLLIQNHPPGTIMRPRTVHCTVYSTVYKREKLKLQRQYMYQMFCNTIYNVKYTSPTHHPTRTLRYFQNDVLYCTTFTRPTRRLRRKP